MQHKVEITDRTFEDLREYCKLNDLKIGQFADKLIREGLMIEMYGDVPFTNYRKPVQETTIEEFEKGFKNAIVEGESNYLVNENAIKAIDKETKDRMIETMEKVEAEHPQTYITNQEGEKEIQKEMLKQLGVPDKVVSKITRRRLK
jgi:hypothetical protein